MPKLITQVVGPDKDNPQLLQGNYEDVFIYTLNASFNGIEEEIDSAQITMDLPDFVTIYFGDTEEPIKSITSEPVPETTLTRWTIDLGAIEDLGISLRLGFGVAFLQPAPSGTTFTLNSKLIINGTENLAYTDNPITLLLEPKFALTRERVLPVATPGPGGVIFYKVTVKNFGDLGAPIENLQIFAEGSESGGIQELTIMDDFPVTLQDTSRAPFQDPTIDTIEGVIETAENRVRITVPNYRGEQFEFFYKAIISDALVSGDEITSDVTWSIDGTEQDPDTNDFILEEPIYNLGATVYGPDYTRSEEEISVEVFVENTGNQILQNLDAVVSFDHTDVDFTTFYSGIYKIGAIDESLNVDYVINYTTDQNNTGVLGTFNTNNNSKIDLSTVLPAGEKLAALSWSLPQLSIGVKSTTSPTLDGIVKENRSDNTAIRNTLESSWDQPGEIDDRGSKSDRYTTFVDDIHLLIPSLNSSIANRPVKPKEVYRYTMQANMRRSRLENPIFAMLLPPQLSYNNNAILTYNPYFTTDTSPLLPDAEVIPDFDEFGNTLVRFRFTDDSAYNFTQKSTASIAFDVIVNDDAKGRYNTKSLLNTLIDAKKIPGDVNEYEDTDNIAGTGEIPEVYAVSNSYSNQVLEFITTSSNKKVKGLLDTEYKEVPEIGFTLSGGTGEYVLSLINKGNAELESVEMIDILPYKGDTGVVEIDTNRNSDFQVYAISDIAVSLITGPTDNRETITIPHQIFYSTSTDPVRFGGNFDTIGTDDNWTTTPPNPLSTLRSLKIIINERKILTNEEIQVKLNVTVPVDTPETKVAWNSFAIDVTYFDSMNNLEHLLAMEPEKVGLRVDPAGPDTGTIRGFVFRDLIYDGIYTDTESRINDIGVVLYNEEGTPLQATFTTTNYNGEQGFYSFSNLPYGDYYVKFFINDKKDKFTKFMGNDANGSAVRTASGVTPRFTLSADTDTRNVLAGIVAINRVFFENIMKANRSANQMLRTVIYNQMLISNKLEDTLDLIE